MKLEKLIESGSSREFFAHIKRKKTTNREQVPPLKMPDTGELTLVIFEKQLLLNSYFCSVFTEDNNKFQNSEVPIITCKKSFN